MDDPVARVLREGLVVGLANHTLLIARDGEMRPIADSGAPIRNDENEIAGAVLVFRDQSEERRARKALEKSEAMLKESQRVAALGHYTVDVTTGIWSSSETLDEIYGIDANFTRDFDGWVGLMPRDQREEMASRYADHVRAGQNPMDSEYRILRANDGAERWVRSRGTLAFDRGGQPVTMFGIIQDITDRKLKEEALRTSEAMLKESQRVAALGHYYFDVATGIWSSSEMLDEVYGIDANFTRDVDGWIGLIHPDQREEMAAYFADHVLAGRNTFDREYRILRANDGAERWVHGRGNLAFDSEGQPVTMFGIIQDVTDRKLKDEALRTSEARYRKAQAIGRVGHWEYDLATETFWGSEEANKISGFDPDHPGFSVDEVGSCFPDRIRVHQALLDLIERGTAYDIEFDIVAVDGSGIKTVHSTAVLEKDADGKPVKVIGVVQDITERKLMEEELRTNEARYRKAQAIGRVGHWEYHPMSDKYYGSEEAKRIYGFDPDQPGFSPDEVEACIPDRKRVHQALLDLLEKGTAYDLEFDIVAADSGKTKTIQSIAVLESDAAGRPVKVSGVVQDITERKQMEDQLRKLSRTYSLLSEVNQIIVHERDTHAVFEAVCRISVEVGGFYMVRIRLPDPQTQEFVTIAQAGNENWVEKWNSAPDHGESDSELTASVVRTGKHVVVNDLEIDPDTAAWLNKLQLPCRATAAFPLAIAGEVCGTLNLYSGEPGFFDIEEVRVLDGMAADISFAMAFNKQEQQRREAEDRTEEHLLHLSALRAIDLAISSSLDLRVTLTILLEQVIGTLRVDASAVFLLSPGINQLEYAAGRGFSGTDITGVRLKLGECIIGQSALERRTINIPNLDEVKSNPLCAELSAKEGFVAMVAVPLIAKGKVKGVLGVFHRSALNPNPDWLEFMEALAGQAAIAIDSSQLFDQLQRSNMEQALAYDATIEGWSKAMDLRDEETEGHSLRVTDMTMKMARAAGISETEMVHVRRGALLHDMGKMGIPDSILLKPGPLTDEEMTIMRTHPSLAFDMLAPIPFLRPALDIPGCHHEKWDGTGYPRGLKGERIPLAARLFAVVDVWDALRSDRPYRKAWEEERVLEHIRAQSGTHFEPKAVEVFFRVLAENKEA
jgi:PAS domain S-box-containing protein